MHIIVLKENLVKALAIIGKAVSIRPQLPILSYILLKTKEGQLELSATNLELGIVFTIAAKIEKQGEIAAPGKLFIEFINSLSTDKVEMFLDDKVLKVKTGKTYATFNVGNSNDFPPFPDILTTKKTLPLNKISESVLRTVFAASQDEGRPVLTGVRTKIVDGRLSLAATDGYRLSKEEVDLSGKQEPLEIILPAQSLLEVIKIAQEVKAEEVGFSLIENKNQVIFSLPNAFIFTRLIDGEFPNIDKIIPSGFKTKVMVEKELLAQSVKTTSIFARGAANIIKIKIEKDGLRLSANTPQVGEEEDFIEAKVEGEEVEVAFNFRFLLDLLNNFPDKDLIFESSGALSPGVFKPSSSKISFLHIIMPVRVQGE